MNKTELLPAVQTVKKILNDSATSDDLKKDFNLSFAERYKNFIFKYINYYENTNHSKIKLILNIIELLLIAGGAALGFFLIHAGVSDSTKLVVWISYIIIFISVGLTTRLIPKDENIFYLEAKKIKLINLSERLATEIALFSLLQQTTTEDDEKVISKISDLAPNIAELEEDVQKQILSCQDSKRVYTDPRDTNIVIKDMGLDSSLVNQLNSAIREIVELCGHLFSERDFSAKLYLRVEKPIEIEKNTKVELLIPFARFPSPTKVESGSFGSSWIKARGNPSMVWECLEKGQTIHMTKKDFKTYTAYYSSVLAICLPGRIGVLALTANSVDAFENKYDDWSINSLALSTRMIFLRLLGINE